MDFEIGTKVVETAGFVELLNTLEGHIKESEEKVASLEAQVAEIPSIVGQTVAKVVTDLESKTKLALKHLGVDVNLFWKKVRRDV